MGRHKTQGADWRAFVYGETGWQGGALSLWISSLAIFVATFFSVLAIGVQMRAIAKRQILLAVLSACVVAGGQLVALKIVPSSSSFADYGAYILGNGFGILCSFWLYASLSKKGFRRPLDVCQDAPACPFGDGKHPCSENEKGCPVYETLRRYYPITEKTADESTFRPENKKT